MKKFPIKNYDKYKAVQIHRSARKWNSGTFWKVYPVLRRQLLWILEEVGTPENLCCLGIRNGNEYFGFKQLEAFSNTEIYGVDINPDVKKVGKNCFAYDFNKLPKSWKKKFDWVYSNSLDHAFDVKKTLKEWHRICSGYLILNLSSCGLVTQSDIYDFSIDDIEHIFDTELFDVIAIWETPKLKSFTVLVEVL